MVLPLARINFAPVSVSSVFLATKLRGHSDSFHCKIHFIINLKLFNSMAKVGVWLRGARGKLAGNVLHKGEKATIIRENVIPRNPQSVGQMLQRVAFGTVASAAKYLLPIIGQTFEGNRSEKENRRAFIRENVNKLKADFIAFNNPYGDGTLLSPDTSAATAKGVSALVPNNYILSKGTLVQPQWIQPRFNAISGITFQNPASNGTLHAQTGGVISLVDVLALFGLRPGDQITLVWIDTMDGSAGHQYDGINNDYIRYGNMRSARVVLSDDEDLYAENAVNVTADMTINQAVDAIRTGILACIDMSKSDSQLASLLFEDYSGSLFTVSGSAGDLTVAPNTDSPNPAMAGVYEDMGPSGAYTNKAFGAFISHFENGTWKYSPSRMVSTNPGAISTSNQYHGLRYNNALATYKADENSQSMLYTQQGGGLNAIG